MAKGELNKLLKKGLTGWEVGLIAIEDFMGLREELKKPTFSKAEFGRMKDSLKTAKDIEDYNKLIAVLDVVGDALHVAEICELSALADLGSLEKLTSYGLARASIELHLNMIPKIVTQKQLDDYIQEDREDFLGRIWPLTMLIQTRAISLANKANPDYRYDIGMWAWEEIPEEDLHLFEKHLPQAKEEITHLISDLLSIEEDGEESYLVQDLYEAGMEEIREMVDKISIFAIGAERFPPLRRIAVIQEPSESAVDEKGHYIDRHGPPFTRLGPTLASALTNREEGEKMITILSKRIRNNVRSFYAIRAVMEQLTEVLEINLLKSVNVFDDRLQNGIDAYNGNTDLLQGFLPHTEDKNPFFSGENLPEYLQTLPIFDLKNLTPSKTSIKKVRERISKILGEGWWMQDLLALFEYQDPDGWTKEKTAETLGLLPKDLR